MVQNKVSCHLSPHPAILLIMWGHFSQTASIFVSVKSIHDPLCVRFRDLCFTTSVTMNPSDVEEFDIKGTYHDIILLCKLESLGNCLDINLTDVKCAMLFIYKLYGKTYPIITYPRKEYKIKSWGLKKELGQCWPRHNEYCFVSKHALSSSSHLDDRMLLQIRHGRCTLSNLNWDLSERARDQPISYES